MSSPAFGAFQPMADRINALRDMGSKVLDVASAPGQMVHDMVTSPSHEQQHQQAIQQMNQQTNSHNNDAANASFQPNLSTMKKPLGR